MQMKSLVKELMFFLQPDTKDQMSKNFFIDLEEQLTLNELSALLKQYEDTLTDVTVESLKPFLDFLEHRWQRIQNTDAVYMHSPNSHANRTCLMMAFHLSPYLNIDPYKMLIPTLNSANIYLPEKSISKFAQAYYPQELILTDDNHHLLDVYSCLYSASKNNFDYTFYAKDEIKKLNENEKYRLIYHSRFAKQFDDQNRLDSSLGQRTSRKFKFAQKIKKENYEVIATYGEESFKILQKNLYSAINTLDQLCHTLHQYPLPVWEKFLSQYSVEDLRKIILNGRNLKNVLQDPFSYKGNETYDRAVLVASWHLYRRELDLRPPHQAYTSILGSWSGYSTDEKRKSSDIPYQFLLSGSDLKDFSAYIAEKQFDQIRPALTHNTQTIFLAQMVAITDPDFHKQREQKHWFNFRN